MPVDHEIDHKERFVTITARGTVVLQEILDCMEVVVAQNAMGYPKLIDAREAVGQLSNDDIMMLGACAKAYADFDPRGPVAAVATLPETFEYLGRFRNLAEGERPIRMFTSLEAARAWLDGLQ